MQSLNYFERSKDVTSNQYLHLSQELDTLPSP